jgi:DeoR family transcriptional regulator, fructose operon transcriptional repressor
VSYSDVMIGVESRADVENSGLDARQSTRRSQSAAFDDSDGVASYRALGAQRLEVIGALVREHGSVHARDLVQRFGVTDETIRRDLAKLEVRGLLRRTYGGAIAVAETETTFASRLVEHEAQKQAIATRALEFVQDGMTIVLDSGTTTLALARLLGGHGSLVVVTNAVTNVLELVKDPKTTVILTGGVVRPNSLGAVGELASLTLDRLTVDVAFLAIHSVSAAAGLTYPTFEEVAVKQHMIRCARRVILLADGFKLGRAALIQVAPLSVVDTLITAGPCDHDEEAAIRRLGVNVIHADEGTVAVDGTHPTG